MPLTEHIYDTLAYVTSTQFPCNTQIQHETNKQKTEKKATLDHVIAALFIFESLHALRAEPGCCS